MKTLRVVAAILCLSLAAFGQVSKAITSTQCAEIGVSPSTAVVAVEVTGTWSGTLQPKGTIQGQTAFNVQATPSTSSTAQATITANGAYSILVAGYSSFQLCGATVASGTANVFLNYSNAPAGSGAGAAATTPGGSNGQPQYNNAGAFGGMSGYSTNGIGLTAGATGFLDLASGPVLSAFKWPSAAGALPTTANVFAWDSTALQPVFGNGSLTRKVLYQSGSTPVDGNCGTFDVTGTSVSVQDFGFPCVAPSAVPTQVVKSGLLAEYRMLPSETPASLVDYSGNGNNATGTVGTAPTIIAGTGGVSFAGTGAISLPAALNTAQTVQFVVNFQYAGAAQYNGLLSATPGTATKCSIFMLDNQHGVVNASLNYIFETWDSNFRATKPYTLQGTGLLTWEINTSGNDLIQINNSNLQTFGNFLGTLGSNNYQLGGAAGGGGGACPAVTHYLVGQLYYAVFYNRMLTQAEVNQNNEFLTNVMTARGTPVLLQSTSTTDSIVFHGDSEPTFVPNTTMSGLITPLNMYTIGESGFTISQLVADAPFAVDPFYQTANNRPAVLFWGGTNDSGGSAQTTVNYLNGYCRARHARGFACGVMTMMDRSGASTFKNTYDGLIRQYWPTFADFFVDVAASTHLGCDGCAADTTYMVTGLHPTTGSGFNIVGPYVQRGINRYYGHKDWTSATTYTTGAPAATAITAASESSDTVTITSALNPPVGSCVVIAGVTPADYNNVTGECWNVLTTNATTFTFRHFLTGLGVGTVFGTAAVPLQKDVDVYTILGGSAVSPDFTLQPCGGYTGQRLYIKNANTTTPWDVVPFGAETIDGAASLTMPIATSGDYPVVVLESTLVSSAAAGCNWLRIE